MKDMKSYTVFPRISNYSKIKIVVFTDASLGNIIDGTGSTGAHMVWLVDDTNGRCCPITWHARKIKRVVRSTIAAEALSIQEGLESSVYYKQMVEEVLDISIHVPTVAYTDNISVIEALLSTKLVDDKRLRVDIAAIQEFLETSNKHEVRWCSGDNQLANCLTKQGASGYQLLEVLQTGQMPNYNVH